MQWDSMGIHGRQSHSDDDGRVLAHRQAARRPVSRVLSTPSWRGTTIPLERASRRASRDQPGRRSGKASAPSMALSSLFGLAPGGVYPAAPVARGAVRSCRTVSPLPAGRLAVLARAVCFLWHFPWGHPRRPLAGTVFPWSPDFPLPPGRQRPSGRLAAQQMATVNTVRQVPHWLRFARPAAARPPTAPECRGRAGLFTSA